MNKQMFRPIIFHLFKEGKKSKEIHEILVKNHGQAAPCATTVSYWLRKFKWGCESMADEPRYGHPISAIDDVLIDNVAKAIDANRKIGILTLAQHSNSAYGTIHKIIHYLNLEKKFAIWVPHTLSEAQLANRVEICRDFLNEFERDFDALKARLVTSDETWVLFATPDNANTSREWCPAAGPAPTRERLAPRGEKVMLTVWWDANGIIMLDFWKKSDQISLDGNYYRLQVREMRKELPRERYGAMKRGPIIWIDNAPIHNAQETKLCFDNCRFRRIYMPPYSPDLAPSDYYLFRNLKTWLRGQKFTQRDDLEREISGWFSSKWISYFDRGIDQLLERMKQVVDSNGRYLAE